MKTFLIEKTAFSCRVYEVIETRSDYYHTYLRGFWHNPISSHIWYPKDTILWKDVYLGEEMIDEQGNKYIIRTI